MITMVMNTLNFDEFPLMRKMCRFYGNIDMLNDSRYAMYTLVVDRKDAAYALVDTKFSDGVVKILAIEVSRNLRGRGHGTVMLNTVKSKHRKKTIVLECSDELVPFYEKNGFYSQVIWNDDIGCYDSVMMHK